MVFGIADIDTHGFVPAIGEIAKPGIKRGPQHRDRVRQGIGKILILAAPKAVAPHHHPAAETAVIRIERGQPAALFGGEQSLEHRAALRVEIAGGVCPVDRIDARNQVEGKRGMKSNFGC